jgi:phosphate transport system substrate-binding protein
MSKKSGPPPIVFILTFLALFIAGYWFFLRQPAETPISPNNPTSSSVNPNEPSSSVPSGSSTPDNSGTSPPISFPFPTSVSNGSTVKVDGSTSMVQLNKAFQEGFQKQFPGTTVITNAGGSAKGIQDLLTGQVDIAAVSRDLTAQEQSQGLVAVPVAMDAIAIVVGNDNPFRTGLTTAQVSSIFQGQVTNWSDVGGSGGSIHVINRPEGSGTQKAFLELVLKGASFGTGSNFTTLERDATTPMLQALKTNGIGYATYAQVANQRTVRTVAIDGLTPEAQIYPFKRQLYYIYKNPPSSTVQAFLGFATSPQGQQLIGTPR